MAPALTVRPLASERVRSLEWKSEDTTLTEIVAQLARMTGQLARHEAGDDEHPHPRNCVMNIITVVQDRDDARRVASIMADLAAQHPSRSIVLHTHSHGQPSRIAAVLRADAHSLIEGFPIQHEQVTLHVQGAALEHVRGIVEPLLIPDVRTHLWWTGTPPLGDPVIADTLDLCETLVIDSARFERPHESLLALARLADEKGRDVGIADFQWARASAWRALLAQFFEPAERRQFLDGIDAVGIDYAGVGRGNPVAAALFAGWLASALHWKLQRAAGGAGDAVTVYLEGPDGHSVEIGFGSVAAAGRAEGEIVALSVEAAANRQTARFEIARAGDGDAAEMRAQVGEGREIRQRLPLGMTEDAELLVGLLVQGRMDEVYQRALRAAVQLLESAR